ncbi:MAG TPA: OB-fold nucleic acid binding domain-containing protein, partial [Myxococcota bacterium]|nr:OB-fold nucleic acid binding domain-containing protein [Myxococcota bacterium]
MKSDQQLKNDNSLAIPLAEIKGVGPKTKEALSNAGLFSVFDLLLRVPKSVVEELDCPGFAFMEVGRTYVAKGRVIAKKISGHAHKKRLQAILRDDTGRLTVVFFGPAVNYAEALLKDDALVTVIGEAKSFLGQMQMVHPKLIAEQRGAVAPSNKAQYSQIGGIQPKTFKAVVDKAINFVKENGLNEHLPMDLLRSLKLSSLDRALLEIHHPTRDNGADWDMRTRDPHFNRLAFEELLAFYVPIFVQRSSCPMPAGRLIPKTKLSSLCEGVLPFALTKAQERVMEEILTDMAKNVAMSRMLQGDVGSGKTAVSALSALQVVINGGQVAVMAPTEILAEQL